VRLAEQVGDTNAAGRALINLSDQLASTDPASAAEAARTAAGYVRRNGARYHLAVAIMNLSKALLQLGGWDAAEAELAQAADSDALADIEALSSMRAWLAALRGDDQTAKTMLAALQDLRASEDPQDQAMVDIAEAFTAAARGHPQDALRHARAVLAHAEGLGISAETPRWAWPLAARCADELAAARTSWPTPAPPGSCWPCSTPTSPGTWLPCCGPNATWPGPG
jgi:hypothetical protein